MSTALSTSLAMLALVLAALALVLATVANRRWAARRAPRPTGGKADGSGGPGIDLQALSGALDELRAELDALGPEVAGLRTGLAEASGRDLTALRHVAVVRYDAFADVGGRLSYSVALLDDTRSGLVLTTLAGKSDVRTYVRTVSAGAAEGTLTAEEQQAIDAAGAPGSQP